MAKNEHAPRQSAIAREQLSETKGNEPVPALAGGKPEADKPKHDEVETPAMRQKREAAAAVRSGTRDRDLAPNNASVDDPRTAEELDELAADDLAKQRFQEQVAYARARNAPEPVEGTALDLERDPHAARIDGEPVEQPKKGGKR